MLGRIFLDERVLEHCSFELSYCSETPVTVDVSSMLIFHFLLLLTVMLFAEVGGVALEQRTTQGIASLGYAGMLTTVVGVFLCALERESENEDRADKIPDGDVLFSGYALAFVNVFFDAMGAFLTKRWGGPPLDALDITVIRFGAASVMLLAVYLVMKVAGMVSQKESLQDAVLPYDETKPLLESGKREGLVPASLIAMTRREWLLVTMGVLLVTCCNPVLYNYRAVSDSTGIRHHPREFRTHLCNSASLPDEAMRCWELFSLCC